MAGSWNHIVNEKGEFIGTELIDNLGDAYEALEECYNMIAPLKTLEKLGAERCIGLSCRGDSDRRWKVWVEASHDLPACSGRGRTWQEAINSLIEKLGGS